MDLRQSHPLNSSHSKDRLAPVRQRYWDIFEIERLRLEVARMPAIRTFLPCMDLHHGDKPELGHEFIEVRPSKCHVVHDRRSRWRVFNHPTNEIHRDASFVTTRDESRPLPSTGSACTRSVVGAEVARGAVAGWGKGDASPSRMSRQTSAY
jgi:hypothetical protein